MSTNDAEPNSETSEETVTETGVGPSDAESSAPVDGEESAPEAGEGEGEADESGAEAEGEGEAIAAAPVAASAASATQPASGAKAAEKLTPGQRLAAQKAAKAAKKVAMRGREADLAQEKAIEAAEQTTAAARSFVETHSKHIVLGVAALVAVLAVLGIVDAVMERQDRAAARLLWAATEAERAEVRAADAPEPESNGDFREHVTFTSRAAREREALRRYRKVIAQYPSSEAAAVAHLSVGSILLGQGKPAEARRELEAAERAIENAPELEARALEGIGLTYFEERNFGQANQHFEELGRIDQNRYRNLSDYQMARVLYAQGNSNAAKQKLQAILERLSGDDAASSPYVRQQAELLLQQIDPSSAPRSAPSMGGGGLDSLPPEMLEQLMRQLQGGGGAPQ